MEGATLTQVRMPVLVAPVTVNGRTYTYVYFNVILETGERDIAARLALKIPYLQDAFVREVFRRSIALDGDPKTVDGEGLKARLLARCAEIAGAGQVKDILFENKSAEAMVAAFSFAGPEPIEPVGGATPVH